MVECMVIGLFIQIESSMNGMSGDGGYSPWI